MLIQYVLAVLLVVQGGLALEGRITDAIESPPHQFPSIVSIVWGRPPFIRYRHVCAGSILNKNWILTAGHCVTELPAIGKIGVFAAKHMLDVQEDEQQFSGVSLKIVHWKYAGGYGEHNIALLKLVSPLKFDENVKSIDLPTSGESHEGTVVLAGWGSISKQHFPIYPSILQTATVPIIDNDVCYKAFHTFPADAEIYDTQICTGPVDTTVAACTGDDGGPLVKYDDDVPTLIGVIALGRYPCPTGLPTVYTRVSAYIDWIKHKIDN